MYRPGNPGPWYGAHNSVGITTLRTRSGLADARFKLSVNLRGNPAMSPREFAAAPRHTIVGASLTLTAPAGQYYETKLINLGTNRWSFKPEVGISVPKGRWYLDAYVGYGHRQATDSPLTLGCGEAVLADLAAALKATVSIPVMAAGRFLSLAAAETALVAGKIDLAVF